MNNKTAIIVLNYNDSKTVIEYLGLIKDYKNIDKILVVDNCSPDNSYEVLKKYESKKICVIKTDSNKGYAYGNNYGVHYLEKLKEKYDFIIISNPDINVTDDTIKKCSDFLNKNLDVAIVSPTMYMSDGKASPLAGWKERKLNSDVRDSSIRLTKKYKNPHVECYDKSHFKGNYSYVDCVPGSFFMIRYNYFKEVGYFDENTFLYFEEDILGKKLKNAGYKVVVLNKEKFIHYESVSINKSVMPYKKYKILQKSKRYYHSHYNEECKGIGKLNLLRIDYATLMGKNEIRIGNSKIVTRIKKIVNNIKCTGLSLLFVKMIIYLFTFILLPFKLILRKLRKNQRVCYFSLVTWKWIKQRPHFVALKIAEKYKVDYTYLEVIKKYQKQNNKELSVADNNVDNNNLNIKPFYIYPGEKKFKLLQNLRFLKMIFINYDKVVFTQPNQVEYLFLKVLKMNKTTIFYECMDNYIGWEKIPYAFENNERNLIGYSKNIFVSSQSLKSMLVEKYSIDSNKVVLVRNGYDHNLFDNYKKQKTNLSKPNVVYIGTIDEWFDIDNIVDYAKKNKKIKFYLIGPINPKMKKINKLNISNIIVYGPIEHKQVPSFIDDSTVMIMPFKINEIIKYVDPVKIYEYLYFKKPIVSSYWKELDQFNDLMYYYKDKDEFEKVLDKALNSKFKETKRYDKIMEESKWDNRLDIYLNTLEDKNE